MITLPLETFRGAPASFACFGGGQELITVYVPIHTHPKSRGRLNWPSVITRLTVSWTVQL